MKIQTGSDRLSGAPAQLARVSAVFSLIGFMAMAPRGAHAQPEQTLSVLGVECSKIYELGIDKQENLRATLIRIGCGLEPAGALGDEFAGEMEAPAIGENPNVNTITGAETWPKVTQSESMAWSNPEGTTIVVNYNDSASSPGNYSGISVSTDSGATFTRLLPAPFANGHGTNFGDPIVVFNVALNRWFAGDLATGCGGQGIALWTSTDGMSWTPGACAHNGGFDDRETMWVDNNAASPFFGRMYLAWNDFAAGQRIYATHSDDGTTWSAPVALSPGFIRTVQLTGSPTDGTVFVAAMDEGGGGVANRTNIIYRSNNGGTSWTEIRMGPSFPAAGTALCGFFAAIPPLWRHMGWGQPGVGPDNVIHYAYAGRGITAGDLGDIYYTRSTDAGDTWSTPIVLNTDAAAGGNHAQWMPSLSVTTDGRVEVTWYDRRNTAGNEYQYFGIQSQDNGLSWDDDGPVSDVVPIAQPEQPDSSMVGCYAGDYNYQSTNDQNAWVTWTDGRNLITGHSQQDVYFAAVPFISSGGTLDGRVVSDSTGDPIAGARVRAVGMVERSRVTDPAGNYRFRLPADTYTLTVNAFSYTTQVAKGVQVVEGQGTTRNFSLVAAPAHRLSGAVYVSRSGVPLPGVEVRILNTPIPPTRTDATGAYEFASVPDGSYTIRAGSSTRCWSPLALDVAIAGDTTLDFPIDVRTDAFGYACDDGIPFAWVPGQNLLGVQGIDGSQPVPIPFPFTFYGQIYSVLHVATSGFGTFLQPDITAPGCIPSPARHLPRLAPFWASLAVNRPAGIYTRLQGDPGARQLIIEWRDVTFQGQVGAATFEIILNESDNSIVYQYNRADGFGDGRSATIGIENETGTVGSQYSCREPVVSVGKAVRFYLAQ